MKLNHINILVTDLDRSIRFYSDVFGARYLRNLGPRKVITDLCGYEFFIEEVSSVKVNTGWHIGFRTDRNGVHELAKRLGILSIPLVKGNNPEASVFEAEDGFRTALYFEDPDGLLIEVYSPERQTLIDEGVIFA
jgi:catechol 2,3-dioxygenase-like lactoylglutathione lyase family enzyme